MTSEQIDNIQDKLNWHWRNTMRTVRFFTFDARAALPLPILIVYARLWTIILCIVFLIFFRYLERKGLTFPAALRAFRSYLNGKDRLGWIKAQNKKFIDYG